MSKKRKTKKQKITASTRHQFPSAVTFNGQQIQIAPVLATNDSTQAIRITHDYSYVTKDVRKTLFITSVLITLNILIFFLLKLSIINIPGITF